MNFNRVSWIILILFPLVCGCSKVKQTDDWNLLFDGVSLNGWDTYLGPVFTPGVTWDNLREQPSPGLNMDTAAVFSIVQLDGSPALRISGQYWGGISTREVYEDYHLQLKFKWGERKWYPKENDRRDSGLLYHGFGNQGDGDGFWLRSQEFQVQEQDCGDYWGVAGAIFDIRASLNSDSVYQYNPESMLLTFRDGNGIGRHCKKYPDAENPSGEWNTLDLYVFGNKSMHVVNGTATMILENSRFMKEDQELPLTKGKIQLQSEGAEVFYRDIKIRKIDSFPSL